MLDRFKVSKGNREDSVLLRRRLSSGDVAWVGGGQRAEGLAREWYAGHAHGRDQCSDLFHVMLLSCGAVPEDRKDRVAMRRVAFLSSQYRAPRPAPRSARRGTRTLAR